jgi:LysM repeat protein
MRRRSRSPLRILAPLALIAFVLAFVVVLSTSGVSDNKSSEPGPATSTTTTTTTTTSTTRSVRKFARRRTYSVKTGDTLGAIAVKTGVSVTTLEALNPGLDPQGLVAGQKIKLR